MMLQVSVRVIHIQCVYTICTGLYGSVLLSDVFTGHPIVRSREDAFEPKLMSPAAHESLVLLHFVAHITKNTVQCKSSPGGERYVSAADRDGIVQRYRSVIQARNMT